MINLNKPVTNEVERLKRKVEIYRLKIREQAIELEKLEEQLQDEVRLDADSCEFIMKCVDELNELIKMMICLPPNIPASEMIEKVENVINKLKGE